MRRLPRWAFNLFAAVSTLLFVATCVLWVRGQFAADSLTVILTRHDGDRWRRVIVKAYAGDGVSPVWFHRAWTDRTEATTEGPDGRPDGRPGPAWDSGSWLSSSETENRAARDGLEWEYRPIGGPDAFHPARGTFWQKIGFNSGSSSGGDEHAGHCSWLVRAPHWLLILLTSAAPALWAMPRFRRRRRARTGLCPSCGYDLRATPSRCPECGAVPREADRLGRAGAGKGD